MCQIQYCLRNMALANFWSGYLNERADTFKSTITIHVAFHKDTAIKIFIYVYHFEVIHQFPLNKFCLKNRRLPSLEQTKKSCIISINNYVQHFLRYRTVAVDLNYNRQRIIFATPRFITCWVIVLRFFTIGPSCRNKHQNLHYQFYRVYTQ